MTTSPSKTLSPAELAKLEHAFASDPASDSYRPLAEAYLGMGRFMEAMVVCKKGVKAHPTEALPRVLLARVYADQGKEKKALEELSAALQVSPSDKHALRMTGVLQLKTGEESAGKASLLKALEADPHDEETRSAMEQWKVELPAPPAPVAPPVVAAPPPPAPAAAPSARAAPPTLHAVPNAPAGAESAPAPAPAAYSEAPSAPRHQAVARAAAPRPAPRRYEDEDYDREDSVSQVRPTQKKPSQSKLVFLVMAVGLPLIAGGVYFRGQHKAKIGREIKKQLSAATDALKHDSYDWYIKACESAEKALEVDSDSALAHGYLAYAWTIRWGEHGGGDDARAKAEEHLKAGKESDEPSSYRYAAQALFDTYSGKGAAARTALEAQVKDFDAQGRSSSMLYLTQGLIQMNAGDLERAKESLDKAQQLAPSDARVYAALGNLYRRRGQDNQAEQNFITALRYEKGHPESMLGSALLELDKDEPDYGKVTNILKRMIEQEPPPSPRQLAAAHLARALMVSRVSNDLPLYKADFQKELTAQTGITADKAKATAEIQREESTGFALDSKNPELRLLKAKRLLFEKQYDPAAAEVRLAIQQDNTRAQFYVELARALMAKEGGEKEATVALVTAIKTMGDSPKLVVLLGQAYQRQGKLDDAIAQFKKATEGKGKNPDARLALGIALREKKDPTAAEVLDKAAQEFIGQTTKIAEAYTEAGRAFEDKGDKVKADETYLKALNADAGYAPAYFFYGKLLSGDRKSAGKSKELAKKYLELEPKGRYAAEAQKLVAL